MTTYCSQKCVYQQVGCNHKKNRMTNQIPDNTKEKLIQAINTTKNFLNHEFLNYIKTTNSINPSEWTWVTKPYLAIFGEKPNLPNGFYSKLENLYTNIFQFEANKLMDIMRQFSDEGITVSKGENAKKFDLQYDKWRTDFTVEANKIINELEGKNDVPLKKNIELLKELVAKGKIDKVITQLLELYQESFEEQNILYGLSFRRRTLERENIKGVLGSEEKELEQNKIVSSVLKMIDGLNE